MVVAIDYWVTIVTWLGIGLILEALLAWRQWHHLSGQYGSDTAQDRRVAKGQRHALLRWFGAVESVTRIGLWLPTGLLGSLYLLLSQVGLLGAMVFVVLFATFDRLLRLPLSWVRQRWLERQSGMSDMRAGAFVCDAGRSIAVEAVTAAVAVPWLLWPFLFWPTAIAWLVSTMMLMAGAILQLRIKPNLIAPLFNRFTPLPAGKLRTRLRAMMQRCDTSLDEVLVMDGSRRSNLANAYFTGVGRSKRVVLLDTLIQRLEPAEIEAVLAHELGHYRCGHLHRYYGLLGALMAIAYMTLGILESIVAPGLSPPVAMVSAYLLLPPLAWPLKPVLAGLRRRYEFEADAYAMRQADSEALACALEKLFANNRDVQTMDPLYAAFYATHPSESLRLARIRARAAL